MLVLFVIPSQVKSQALAHLSLLQEPVEPCQKSPVKSMGL